MYKNITAFSVIRLPLLNVQIDIDRMGSLFGKVIEYNDFIQRENFDYDEDELGNMYNQQLRTVASLDEKMIVLLTSVFEILVSGNTARPRKSNQNRYDIASECDLLVWRCN